MSTLVIRVNETLTLSTKYEVAWDFLEDLGMSLSFESGWPIRTSGREFRQPRSDLRGPD